MKIILDINIIISALIKENSIIRALLNLPFFEFYLPAYALTELKKHEKLILRKSGLEKQELKSLIRMLLTRVKIVGESTFSSYYKFADEIIGKIDNKDIPYIALATENDGIWTADKHFKQQKVIQIFTTKDILSKLFK